MAKIGAIMHTRYQGESFEGYLDRVYREWMAETRSQLKARRAFFNPHTPKAVRSQSLAKRGKRRQFNFWDMYHLIHRQHGRCYWCCRSLLDQPFHLDHVYPASRGGKDDLQNIRLSCVRCNCAKNATLPMDFAISLLQASRNGAS